MDATPVLPLVWSRIGDVPAVCVSAPRARAPSAARALTTPWRRAPPAPILDRRSLEADRALPDPRRGRTGEPAEDSSLRSSWRAPAVRRGAGRACIEAGPSRTGRATPPDTPRAT